AIRNTLYAIDLRDGSDPEGPRLRPRDRALIARQVKHLTRLVDDLLDVSRVTSGKVTLKQESLDLVDLTLRCVQALEEMARIHGPTVEFTPPADAVMVAGDPTRLEQVVTNLLTNAIKYTPPGGKVAVRVERTGKEALLTVSDTGVGLSPDMVDSVFDLFSQSDRTLERQHGGDVTARSPGPGKGAAFEVRLPLLPAGIAATASGAPRPSRRAADGMPLRVLIVEDNEDNRESLVALLGQ